MEARSTSKGIACNTYVIIVAIYVDVDEILGAISRVLANTNRNGNCCCEDGRELAKQMTAFPCDHVKIMYLLGTLISLLSGPSVSTAAEFGHSKSASFCQANLILSEAARISPALRAVDEPACLYLTGEITDGDFERFASAVDNIADSLIILNLASSGGDLVESIRIAQLMFQRGNIITAVQPDTICGSACTVLFLAGNLLDGDGLTIPARALLGDGALWFHAIRYLPSEQNLQFFGLTDNGDYENFRREVLSSYFASRLAISPSAFQWYSTDEITVIDDTSYDVPLFKID